MTEETSVNNETDDTNTTNNHHQQEEQTILPLKPLSTISYIVFLFI